MKSNKFSKTDFSQCFTIINKSDRIKLIIIAFIQIFLSMLDLIGVAFFGLIGSVTVSAISSVELAGRTKSVINFIGFGGLSSQNQVIGLGLIAALVMVLKTLSSLYLNKKVIFFLSRKSAIISANLTSKLFRHSFTEIKKRGNQRLIFSITSGVDKITTGVLALTVALLADISLLLVLIVGLMIVNPLMTIILVCTLSLIASILFYLIKNRKKKLAIMQAQYSISSSTKIVEALESFRELFLRGQRQEFADNIGKARLQQADATAQANYLMNINKYILEASVVVITLFISGIQFLLNDALRSVATLTLFLAAISRIAPAIFRIQQNVLTIKSSLGGAKPTLDLISSLNLNLQEVDHIDYLEQVPSSHEDFQSEIRAFQLSFKYPGSPNYAVKNIDLVLKPGSYVAIVGPSGAGKSTLVDLLIGIHKPLNGQVLINGQDAVQAVQFWPGAVSYVPQEIKLISGSVSDNILLGFKNNDINRIQLTKAIIKAQLHEFIDASGQVIDVNIGDEGGKLSGGQRQRIGIARALLTNPKILVMDEATSSLDAQTEAKISNTISSIKNECLVIVVAHRLATVRKADLVIYMQDGTIKAMGSFEEVRSNISDFDTQAKLMGL